MIEGYTRDEVVEVVLDFNSKHPENSDALGNPGHGSHANGVLVLFFGSDLAPNSVMAFVHHLS